MSGAAGNPPAVLVVDDDPLLLDSVAQLLELEGLAVVAACLHPLDALAEALRAPALDLLLSDVAMPDLSGPALARRVASGRPGVGVLFMSGYPLDTARREFGLSEDAPFLRKPFGRTSLARAVRRALGLVH